MFGCSLMNIVNSICATYTALVTGLCLWQAVQVLQKISSMLIVLIALVEHKFIFLLQNLKLSL